MKYDKVHLLINYNIKMYTWVNIDNIEKYN